MTKFLKTKIKDKIDNLVKIYNGLQKLQKLKLSNLEENIENVWSVAFGLIAAIEAILDISQYILAEKGVKIESYGKTPSKLLEAKVINKDFSEKMQKMIGFRNRAIHNYPSLDEEQLYNILQKDVDDFREFLKIVDQHLKM